MLTADCDFRTGVFRWRVDAFGALSTAALQGDSWASDVFGVAGARFSLVLFPRGLRPSGSLSLNVFAVDLGGREAVELESEFWLENGEGAAVGKKAVMLVFKQVGDRGWPDFIKTDAVRGFAGDGPLFVCCRLRPRAADGPQDAEEAPVLAVDLERPATHFRQAIPDFAERAAATPGEVVELKLDEFALADAPDVRFALTFFPHGRTLGGDTAAVYLNLRAAPAGQKVATKFAVWAENESGGRLQIMECAFLFGEMGKGWGWAFAKLADLRRLAAASPLVLHCAVRPLAEKTGGPPALPAVDAGDSLAEKLWAMRVDGVANDLQVIVGEETFGVAQAVLIAGSSWFAEQLGGERKDELEIGEEQRVDGPTVGRLIEWMYRGRLDDFDRQAEVLFPAAIRFGVHSLKAACLGAFKRTFSPANAAARLIFSVEHEVPELTAFALAFVRKNAENFRTVMSSPAMEDLLRTDVELMRRVYAAVNDEARGEPKEKPTEETDC